MRVGIVTAVDATVGLGHARRQATIARALVASGHEVVVAANAWPPEAQLPPGSALLSMPTLDITMLERAVDELAALACQRFVIDLPEPVAARRRSTVVHAEALCVTSNHSASRGIGAVEVRVGSDLHAARTFRFEVVHGRDVAVFGGRDYVLVGHEFGAPNTAETQSHEGHVLVTHGGADPWKLTERTLEAVALSRHVRKVTVVSGSSFDRTIQHRAAPGGPEITVLREVHNMPDVMRGAALAVINGGTTRYELCVAGTPFVAIAVNPSQQNSNQALEELGVCRAVGVADAVDDRQLAEAIDAVLANEPARQAMRKNMVGLFDTLGATRVAQLITDERPPAARSATERNAGQR